MLKPHESDWVAIREKYAAEFIAQYIAKYEDQTPPEYILPMGDLNILMRFAGIQAQAVYNPETLFPWELVWFDFYGPGDRYFVFFEDMRDWVDRLINFLVDDKLKAA